MSDLSQAKLEELQLCFSVHCKSLTGHVHFQERIMSEHVDQEPSVLAFEGMKRRGACRQMRAWLVRDDDVRYA